MTRHGTQWTTTEIAMLRKLYPTTDYQVMADVFNRTIESLKAIARKLKLRRLYKGHGGGRASGLWTKADRDAQRLRMQRCERPGGPTANPEVVMKGVWFENFVVRSGNEARAVRMGKALVQRAMYQADAR